MDRISLPQRVIRRIRFDAERVRGRLQDRRRRRASGNREFRPIFVTGAIGSGTSLLAASLSQRFEVAGAALESARDIARDSCLWIDQVSRYKSVRDYEAALDPPADSQLERARTELQQLYRAKADAPGLPWIVDKGPNTNLVRAAFLARAFPESPFLLIFRDPVANVEGFRRKWPVFGADPLDESIRFWAGVHEAFLEQSASFPERVVCIEYEALVADYEPMLASLSERLDVDLARTVRPVDARAEGKGRGLRGVEAGRIRVVRDANARSYETLSEAEVDRIREMLSPLHERLRERAARSGFAHEAAAG